MEDHFKNQQSTEKGKRKGKRLLNDSKFPPTTPSQLHQVLHLLLTLTNQRWAQTGQGALYQNRVNRPGCPMLSTTWGLPGRKPPWCPSCCPASCTRDYSRHVFHITSTNQAATRGWQIMCFCHWLILRFFQIWFSEVSLKIKTIANTPATMSLAWMGINGENKQLHRPDYCVLLLHTNSLQDGSRLWTCGQHINL